MGEQDPHRLVELYDKLSNGYDRLYNEEQTVKHERVNQILEGRKFRLLIDVGCGTGTFMETIAPSCERLLGLDLSAGMIKLAKARIQGQKTDFLIAASPHLPLRDEIADCVVSISLIDRSPDVHATEFRRVTVPESMIVYTEFDLESFTSKNQISEKIGKRERLYVVQKAGK